MDVFEVRDQLVEDYRQFTSAFVDIRDERTRAFATARLAEGAQWPDPWLSLNPSFATGGTVGELVDEGLLHPECERIFRVKNNASDPGGSALTFHRHQREAIEAARTGAGYVLTTGTGSGKSLAYIVPIVDAVLRAPRRRGIKAIVVYPMNALANSQQGELEKFLTFGYGKGSEPVTYARYTGQESATDRDQILKNPPDILLTNYVMLELVLTRPTEREQLITAARGLEFLVLDELHTYRGRQGSDVALLARRVKDACQAPDLCCVGTSATMASGGTIEDQRRTVAAVATTLFGAPITPDRVIGETLARATAPGEASGAGLANALRHPTPPSDYDGLLIDPLAQWIEATFGSKPDDVSGRLVRQPPRRVPEAAADLAQLTGEDAALCAAAIRRTLLAGSQAQNPDTRRPLFAFRLHQFLSKGDSVYASLEDEATRHLTDQYQTAVPGSPDTVLLPLSFCRECGQEYYAVSRTTSKGTTTYLPRRERDASGGEDANGYLYVCTTNPWPVEPVTEGRLPDSWLSLDEDGQSVVLPTKRNAVPQRVIVQPDGTQSSAGQPGPHNYKPDVGVLAAWVPGPFAFCLRCRVSYEQTRGAEFARLATLDQEGRSSAVSVLSTSIIRTLRGLPERELDRHARKLLTFVDNRQDASLQAGHFNDFVQVVQLRGALYRAAAAVDSGLRFEDLAARVSTALGLSFDQFAANPGAKFSQRDTTERALREIVGYRLFLDLERGWRVTMPNLEQVGLLRLDYVDLAEIADDEETWATLHPALREAESPLREELCRILLDELRRVLAVDVDCLTSEGFERLRNLSNQQLTGPWALPDQEPLPWVGTAYARPSRRGEDTRRDLALSGRSAFGRYLRAPKRFPATGDPLRTEDAQAVISNLLTALERHDLLATVDPNDGRRWQRRQPGSAGNAPGYRIKASALVWQAGTGEHGAEDLLRKVVDSSETARVNPFFRDLYRDGAAELTGLQAREHTAQVAPIEREKREDEFRTAALPLLFCSPTMELGVDIAGLNAVAMRNVPPTPANYAQRSGRAGRSGQPALVVTYCASGNSHDQYFFRRSRDMVAGSVAAPRLDLGNEDLVRSHVHAIWLTETGQSLHARLTELLDVSGEHPSLDLLPEVWRAVSDKRVVLRAVGHARIVLGTIAAELEKTTWWHGRWLEDTVAGAAKWFDGACDRWRDLYRAALSDQRNQNKLVVDQSITDKRIRQDAVKRRLQAENQLRLLRNEDAEQGATDFYSYRYFASEGFLPGYSFPRLPLAAFIPGQRGSRSDSGDYIQRPRFLAISEFGPGALIYHEGARYEVNRVQLPTSQTAEGGVETQDARRCPSCGYHHDRQVGTDRCDNCDAALGAVTHGLLQLQTVFTRRRERISSDEEERRRAGFELETSYRFADHGVRAGRADAAVIGDDGSEIAALVYGDTATVRVTNVGRRRRKDPDNRGYLLDTVKGAWLKAQTADATPEDADLPEATAGVRAQRVLPFVEDRRNVLVLRFVDPVSEEVETTLRYALERGIEAAFQLEDSELSSEALPDPDGRGRILLTESAEGGAGVLRGLHADADAVARAARTALAIAHFDPDTGVDLGKADGASERCERGCYDCLLSYGNQHDHALIDRHAVRDLLLSLSRARTVPAGAGVSRTDQFDQLLRHSTTSLERNFVTYLAEHDHVLPDEAQVLVEAARARPDFVYRSGSPTAVFVDGPQHDAASVAERDALAEDRLMDLGWSVLRVRFDDDWTTVVERRPSVFGAGRRVSA